MHWRYRLKKRFVFLRQLFVEAYRERFIVSVVALSVFATSIAILNNYFYDTGVWSGYNIEPDIENWFCEFTDMKRVVRQPINTFTNFIYLIFGMYFISKGFGDIKRKRTFNLITANHFYSFVLAAISFYVFVCSSFFHSSLVKVASNLDFSAVYSITLFPLMYLSHRFLLFIRNKPSNVKHWNERLLMIIIFTTIYIILTFIVPLTYVHEFVGIFILLIFSFGYYLEKKDSNQTNKNYLLLSVLSIIIAIVFFEFDIKKIWCHPHSWINPHSLWHLFNGTSLMFFYMYIRSERYDYEKDNLRKRVNDKVDQVLNK